MAEDLDLHCLLRQGVPCLAREGLTSQGEYPDRYYYFLTKSCSLCVLISAPGLCSWRAYVVTQSLASASFGVRASTMFKFSKVCIVS